MHSIVLLMRLRPALTARYLRRAAGRAFLAEFGENAESEYFVTEQGAGFAVRVGDHFMGVSSGARYFEGEDAHEQVVGDERAADAVREHRGWVGVDYFGGPGGPLREAGAYRPAYRTMARLARQLATRGECLAVIATASGAMRVYDRSAIELLESKDPAADLEVTPPVVLPADDPRMVAAIARARAGLSEFVEAWDARGRRQEFSAKASFRDGGEKGGRVENMWVSVTAIEGEFLLGVLKNDPQFVGNVRQGQRVRLRLADVMDWEYVDGQGVTRGGFTDAVIREVMGRGE